MEPREGRVLALYLYLDTAEDDDVLAVESFLTDQLAGTLVNDVQIVDVGSASMEHCTLLGTYEDGIKIA